jgi:hypothetical protein
MNLRSRLERIERSPGHNCLRCGADLKTTAEADESGRAEAKGLFARYAEACGDRAQAVELFNFDAPTLARRAGVFKPPERPGFCPLCLEDRTPRFALLDVDRPPSFAPPCRA